ncbi:hypothetical protein [Rufibacter sp. XAAS-G3-1]|uniref:hypothetical protein n=1 Tax=Rufibacter sp. XAAS-G3-1 TaxID=2729134 RepID=UPI0015E7457A|nr:hypothetical protein [Rufibacter sp. XAAS-G3-1]
MFDFEIPGPHHCNHTNQKRKESLNMPQKKLRRFLVEERANQNRRNFAGELYPEGNWKLGNQQAQKIALLKGRLTAGT